MIRHQPAAHTSAAFAPPAGWPRFPTLSPTFRRRAVPMTLNNYSLRVISFIAPHIVGAGQASCQQFFRSVPRFSTPCRIFAQEHSNRAAVAAHMHALRRPSDRHPGEKPAPGSDGRQPEGGSGQLKRLGRCLTASCPLRHEWRDSCFAKTHSHFENSRNKYRAYVILLAYYMLSDKTATRTITYF